MNQGRFRTRRPFSLLLNSLCSLCALCVSVVVSISWQKNTEAAEAHRESFYLLVGAQSNNFLSSLFPMPHHLINPKSLAAPRGYSNGVLTDAGGRLLFVAGQIAWDETHTIVSDDFVTQFDRALANVMTVVNEAGGAAADVARLVMYVKDKQEYIARRAEIGDTYRAHLGKHFPAMVLVEVRDLLDDRAKVEIEAIAVLNS